VKIKGTCTADDAPRPDPDRGTGRTTRQMLAAPQDAVFISCRAARVRYDRDLAAKHGRQDLLVLAPNWLTGWRWQGLRLTGIVVDHDAELNEREQIELRNALTRVR
jgi:hypothetical protein